MAFVWEETDISAGAEDVGWRCELAASKASYLRAPHCWCSASAHSPEHNIHLAHLTAPQSQRVRNTGICMSYVLCSRRVSHRCSPEEEEEEEDYRCLSLRTPASFDQA
ncbi:unnamed protein product [Leuciscus chuanchicus]